MHQLPFLKPGDSVEIIAPASRCSLEELADLKELLVSWELNCVIPENIFGDDLLCANSDEARFQLLKNALFRPETKAVICARGGYGSMRLIPELIKLQPPPQTKLFLGMSDITALNLFLQQQWKWPIVHGAINVSKFSPESIQCHKALLFGEMEKTEFNGLPLNNFAEKDITFESTVTGGNLSLVQASIGTSWQINACDKIIFLEEIDERGYRVDRMLEQLSQAGIFKNAKAIVFGDFIGGIEKNGISLVKPVLDRFAKSCPIPVIQIEGVGHDFTNFPILLGTKASIKLGSQSKLVCFS